ncbi:MAG: bifunctional proline dehydrogenase/L-glutamate gamma-semialdehyde dehydrogenase PutA [Legionella sp.]|nr:bifunctional proline dehydrogenase/L-glutamate gamma-semialdehyde dehydrogenase PutA [Legionella sp.]
MQGAGWGAPPLSELRLRINQAYRAEEQPLVNQLIQEAELTADQVMAIHDQAIYFIENIRKKRKKRLELDSFLGEYPLTSEEGIALMSLAEALLRIPDSHTASSLIKDKLSQGDWTAHLGKNDSRFVNATTRGLLLSNRLLNPGNSESIWWQRLQALSSQATTPVVREAARKAMALLSRQFIVGQTIEEALKHAQRTSKKGSRSYLYSYDMLGEAALTAQESERYFNDYLHAIRAIGKQPFNPTQTSSIYHRPGISIKLSALHPRFEEAQRERITKELVPRVLTLVQAAQECALNVTIDAEESERLELSLDVIEAVLSHPSLEGWDGFGVVVQAYQKRASSLIDWIAALASKQNHRIMVRLVKGAYWDTEIKKAQTEGLKSYPVFTHKVFTDLSFQACVKKLFHLKDRVYPQFATHNAYTAATILELAGDYKGFEMQCLQGMGNALYDQIMNDKNIDVPCRIYAPVGNYSRLLPYLARRLLENGANSSFVHRILYPKIPIASLVENPMEKAKEVLARSINTLPLPEALFIPERKNSIGCDLTDRTMVTDLLAYYSTFQQSEAVSKMTLASLETTLSSAQKAFGSWEQTDVSFRSACLKRFAILLEEHRFQLLSLLCLEAGKTWEDGIAEVREAVDFCRYYAALAEKLMTTPLSLKGYTGESNELSLHPRGVVACISPWNFPLAIFTGQVVAALVTGNCVLAKPAEQTPGIAQKAVALMHEAGFPKEVVQLVVGAGASLGAALVADKRVKAVIFTGSTETATRINVSLATRGGPIVPLIAETGGQNAMIVDSSALLEQVVTDVLTSAFGSAGQRCSALRVLFLQEEIYPAFVEQLKGAMAELQVGDPADLATDVGPVIDEEALLVLQKHVRLMKKNGYEVIYQCKRKSIDKNALKGLQRNCFMPPTVIAIPSMNVLKKEVFGPVLHLVSYKKDQLEEVIEQINQTGYGLTLGIHSRIQQTIEFIKRRVRVGNCYVNRNMIGAVVGVQPFGGEGLSGTGPKAGGPHYLSRLCIERTFTINTTAMGGNARLMAETFD